MPTLRRTDRRPVWAARLRNGGRRGLATVLAVGVTLAVAVAPAGAAVPTPAPAGNAVSVPGRSAVNAYSVTLLTGDRVDLVEHADGKVTTAIQRAPGRDRIPFLTDGRDDDLTVLPGDAAPLVASGALDRRLFQVRRLARTGHDDRRRADLPLIVTFHNGVRAAAALAGAQHVRDLPSIGGTALRQPKAGAAAFWQSLSGAARSAATLGAGVARIWLDERVTLADEQSNTQIGVPAARQRGLTGAGVPVAVLDTGYDATHPDLAGMVTASRDFTDNAAGVKDGHGHGTHVASILAGAPPGAYQGVAPQARLLVGKVCDDAGQCPASAAIAGMEWAVAQGARVVSMSFGSTGSDGTDPLALAVNRLAASSGAIFVAAAGNIAGSYRVGSPAAADAALAVGSVNRGDGIRDFSSGGPRAGDEAVKPDITAPGERIVAARAAETSMGTPVDARYTAASGTSMSTPHVAGAAALLLEQHPTWTADTVKAVLTSTAAPSTGVDVFRQGAGRLDIGRASGQPVYAAGGSVSFGALRWPYRDTPPVSRNVVYHNDGADPVTLTVSLTATDVAGAPAPAGMLSVGADTLTVPARGQASAAVVLTPAAAQPGTFSARLTATAPGGVAVQTALGVKVEDERPTLTVNVVGRDGRPATDDLGQFVLVSSDTGSRSVVKIAGGRGTAALPKGRYSVTGFIQTGTRDRFDATLVHTALTTHDRDRAVTLDARPGKRVDVRTDRPDAVVKALGLDVLPTAARGLPMMFSTGAGTPVYAVPMRAPAGEFSFGVHTELAPPSGNAYIYRLAWASADAIPDTLERRVRDRELATVHMRYRAQGMPALASRASSAFYLPGQSLAWGSYFTVPLPSRQTEYFSGGTAQWTNSMIQRPVDKPDIVDYDGMIADGGTTYTAGRTVAEEWNRAVFGPELQLWKVGSNLVGRWGDDIVASTYLFAPNEPGHTSYPYTALPYVSGTTTLTRDGKVLATSANPGVLYAPGLPADEGRYTLSTTALRTPKWSALSPRVETSWTFTSGHVDGPYLRFLPLLTVRASTDLDDLNRARGGTWSMVDLRVETQKGARVTPIRQVTLEVSTDDGATWRRAPVFGHATQRRAFVHHPHPDTGTGYVSLRMSAVDAAGGSVEQTIIRAYGLA